MDQKNAKALIDKYLVGECTPEEQAQVETWYNQLAARQKDLPELPDYDVRNAQITAGLPPDPDAQPKVIRLWPRVAAAASILVFLGLGFYFYQQNKHQPQPAALMAKNDIKPGSNKAVLTLANGQRIILTGAKNGQLAAQGNTAINKTADGQVAYDAQFGKDNATPKLAYNTITTPRGGQYQVMLPDGSHVWLNAASSITFPTAFKGKDRAVAITGEVYFEVAHNKAMPFRVRSNGLTVEVLGTHFNINAYNDEPSMKTTLLEGSVRVTKGSRMAVIKPGEQATIADAGNIMVKNVDTEEVVAWKNGLFQFKNTDLPIVMRQLSRWYDVQVEYEGKMPQTVFNGKLHRNVNASQVLDILKYFNVNFRIEGSGSQKKIIVTP
ncbi:FecR domain-containing protein [Mucilaginibacter sp. UYCu711]|uniref:FecR domain-containing protein n=1 Tax=Mucilaginibacter sp. UYCu711 TaxID=3156339 RepID=UPI003D1FC8E9